MFHLYSAYLKSIFVFLCCLTLTACGGGGSSSNPTSSNTSPATCGQGSSLSEQLVGRWQQVCTDNGGGSYDLNIRSFYADGTYSQTTKDYSDANCTNSTGLPPITNTGTYSLGNLVTVTTDEATPQSHLAYEIDMTWPALAGGTNTEKNIVYIDPSIQLYMGTYSEFNPSAPYPDTLNMTNFYTCQ